MFRSRIRPWTGIALYVALLILLAAILPAVLAVGGIGNFLLFFVVLPMSYRGMDKPVARPWGLHDLVQLAPALPWLAILAMVGIGMLLYWSHAARQRERELEVALKAEIYLAQAIRAAKREATQGEAAQPQGD